MSGFIRRIGFPAPRAAASLALLCVVCCAALGAAAVRVSAAELNLAYDVRFEGTYSQLEKRLRAVSQLVSKKAEPPATLQGLKRRTQADRDRFVRLLRSRGFYDADVQWSVDNSATPVQVVVRVRLGVRYKITRFDVSGLPETLAQLGRGEGLAATGVILGGAAVADVVIEAEKKLLAQLLARAHPFARLAERRIVVDHDAHTMEVTFVLDAGPQVRFGAVTVKGTRTLEPGYVERRLVFARGDVFDPLRIDKSRKALFNAGVFSSVVFSWGELKDVSADGYVPITVTVTEAKPRSVGAGIKYSSADGFGGHAFWEHRNLLGGAEKLRGEIEVTQLLSTGGLSFREPDFMRPNQSLLLDVSLDADNTDAYDRQALVFSGGFERRFSETLVATLGAAFEESSVTGADGNKDTFTLLGIPAGLRYDSSDNLLDPTRGQRAALSFSPYFDMLGPAVDMFVLKGTGSFYVPLTRTRRQIWATRFTVGSILGEKRGAIPDDKRFYAGGGDSVRGYRYQFVGPLDANDNPVGGRSILQFGSELRVRVADSFGLVPFVEGAAVYAPSYPDFGENVQWAAGLGLRYFTVAGPIRLDVGFPINGRPVDNVFEIYISLGQAF